MQFSRLLSLMSCLFSQSSLTVFIWRSRIKDEMKCLTLSTLFSVVSGQRGSWKVHWDLVRTREENVWNFHIYFPISPSLGNLCLRLRDDPLDPAQTHPVTQTERNCRGNVSWLTSLRWWHIHVSVTEKHYLLSPNYYEGLAWWHSMRGETWGSRSLIENVHYFSLLFIDNLTLYIGAGLIH